MASLENYDQLIKGRICKLITYKKMTDELYITQNFAGDEEEEEEKKEEEEEEEKEEEEEEEE